MNANDFSQLSAESPESRFAQFTPEEHVEAQEWFDWRELQNLRFEDYVTVKPVKFGIGL